MDRKVKKRLEVLQQKLPQLRLKLAGAKEQTDEPGEVERIQAEIAAVESEMSKLRAS